MNITSEKLDGDVSLEQARKEYKEAIDIFPALHKYQNEHNPENLQKLCVEIADFCLAVYASTQNETERNIYFSMIKQIEKKRS